MTPRSKGTDLQANRPQAREPLRAEASGSDRLASFGLIAAVSLSSYLIFIARSGFSFAGRVYFSLFDDAMISMRYARNLVQGHGLVWNPGEVPVEGYTNFLWTLWMAALHWLPFPESKVSLAVMMTGAIVLVANLWLVRRIAESISDGSPRVAALAVLFTGLYYPLAFWTLRGMEVGFLTALVSAAIWQTLRSREDYRPRRLVLLALLLGASVLVRPDGLVPYLVIGAFAFFFVPRRKRLPFAVVLGLVLVLVLGCHTLFRLWYYGAPLPNTYYLKMTGVSLSERLDRGARALARLFLLHLSSPVLLAAAAWGRRVQPGVALLGAVFVSQCAYSVYVGADAWEWMNYANRYITIGAPALLILAALGVERLARAASRRDPRWTSAGLAVLGGGASLVGLFLLSLPSGEPTLFGRYSALRLASATAALAVALTLLVLAAAARARPKRHLVGAALAILVVAQVSGLGLVGWLLHGGFVRDDAHMTRAGVALRDALPPEATIAVVWAGAIPYFSDHFAVDLLGKNDPTIAGGPTRGPFFPGHDKWDYEYSIGSLRPDVILQLWRPTGTDRRLIESAGYDPIPVRGRRGHLDQQIYLRRGAPVDRGDLEAALRRAGW
jgi:hypothetical protein